MSTPGPTIHLKMQSNELPEHMMLPAFVVEESDDESGTQRP
jgi:hypothetical protein